MAQPGYGEMGGNSPEEISTYWSKYMLIPSVGAQAVAGMPTLVRQLLSCGLVIAAVQLAQVAWQYTWSDAIHAYIGRASLPHTP